MNYFFFSNLRICLKIIETIIFQFPNQIAFVPNPPAPIRSADCRQRQPAEAEENQKSQSQK